VRAKDVMSSPVVTVRSETPLKEVAATLVDKRISAVPVVDGNGDLVGIVSEADLMTLEAEPDPRSHIIPLPHHEHHVPRTAAEVMTRHVVALHEQADVSEVAKLMLEHRIKQIPIVDGRRVVGIVARRDVLRVLARDDSDIHVELEDLLDDELLMLGRFRAEVSGGVVTLEGPRDRAGRRLAELLARSVPGVISVRFADAEDPAA
jgi:CBS domain-containing protein